MNVNLILIQCKLVCDVSLAEGAGDPGADDDDLCVLFHGDSCPDLQKLPVEGPDPAALVVGHVIDGDTQIDGQVEGGFRGAQNAAGIDDIDAVVAHDAAVMMAAGGHVGGPVVAGPQVEFAFVIARGGRSCR